MGSVLGYQMPIAASCCKIFDMVRYGSKKCKSLRSGIESSNERHLVWYKGTHAATERALSVVDVIKHLETSAAHELLVLVVMHAVEAVEAPAGGESLVQPRSLSQNKHCRKSPEFSCLWHVACRMCIRRARVFRAM